MYKKCYPRFSTIGVGAVAIAYRQLNNCQIDNKVLTFAVNRFSGF